MRPLSGTGYLNDALSVEQSKEVFAHFGLAVHASNVLEHAVLNGLFTAEIGTKIREFRSKGEWERAYDSFFEKGFTQTFGMLVRRSRDCRRFSQELIETLEACAKVRNHLVHHAQREGAEAIYTETGRGHLVESYQNAVSLFGAANDQIEQEMHALHVDSGVDTQLLARRIEDEMRKLVSSPAP